MTTAGHANLLSVRDLHVVFDTRHGPLTAIDHVSFDIRAGEILGVVGESGAGKSLTGTAIIGLLDPPGRIAAGEIWLDGARIDKLPPDAMRKVRGRQIGAIFQDPLTSLHPMLTIGAQLTETIQTHFPLDARAARATPGTSSSGPWSPPMASTEITRGWVKSSLKPPCSDSARFWRDDTDRPARCKSGGDLAEERSRQLSGPLSLASAAKGETSPPSGL